ncbi:hypothetical protein Tsubulata_049348, partial [Turnera subulata]
MGRDNFSKATVHEEKKKIAIIVTSCFIAICMVVGVTVGITSDIKKQEQIHPIPDHRGDDAISTSNKAIVAICQPTAYKDTCLQTLEEAAGNTTDPKELAKFALMAAIKSLRGATKDSATLDKVAKEPLASQALESCRELLHTAIADLRDSFAHIDSLELSKLNKHLSDLKAWLSAATTYLQTCQDGFKNTTDQVGPKMKDILMTSSQLTSNGLAIVAGLKSTTKDLSDVAKTHRRLLGIRGGFPSWVDAGKRKLLHETPETIKADITVAQDGSGQYKTITDAIHKIPKQGNNTFVLYIKEGVYEENVVLGRSTTHVMMIGDGATKTKITGNLNFNAGVQTFKTATQSMEITSLPRTWDLRTPQELRDTKQWHSKCSLICQSFTDAGWMATKTPSTLTPTANSTETAPSPAQLTSSSAMQQLFSTGAVQTKRVTWKGIKNLTSQEIDGFTAAKFIQGDDWIPDTGVPYTSGLTNMEEED